MAQPRRAGMMRAPRVGRHNDNPVVPPGDQARSGPLASRERARAGRQYIRMDDGRSAAGDMRIVDPADFERAFVEHFPPVYRFIARRVGAALAEDLAAETFATAFRRRATFEPARASVRSWLYGIASNLVRNHWRAEQHLLALDARLVPEAEVQDSSDVVDQRVIAAMLAPRLAAALGVLSRDQREVLLLFAWAQLSHDEIAAALQIAPGTARSRLARGRRISARLTGGKEYDMTDITTSGNGSRRRSQFRLTGIAAVAAADRRGWRR
jgi:RNA polymerase sigma factor (sigma-70 family)